MHRAGQADMSWQRIPPSTRLRRAINARSASLVDRILSANPDSRTLLRNHDPDNNSNTSLHLAALLGLADIAAYLLDKGHESDGISRNLESQTPLMLAAAAGSEEQDGVVRGRVEVAKMLIERCPEGIYAQDKAGMNAFLIAAKHGTLPLLQLMLGLPPPVESIYTAHGSPSDWLACADHEVNTPLHHASATGELKTVRLLVAAGANDKATNAAGWTPLAYSASVAAEVYLRRLVQEREAGEVVEAMERSATVIERDEERRRARGMVRVVPGDDQAGTVVNQGRYERARTRARTAT